MRLLDTKKLEVVIVSDSSVHKYAILSHTWGPKELNFQDLVRLASDTWGFDKDDHRIFNKVTKAASLALVNGYGYIWIDTVCIDKTSSAELSEAINSMYRWYQDASVCYVYLADVAPVDGDAALDRSNLPQSRWFKRGWTLQELIAPRYVRFYAQDWSFISSHKENTGFRTLLSRITGIDDRVLEGSLSPRDLSVSTRMKWAALRQTTRLEDKAYCLMGLFGVNMPLLYGEGKRSFIRLQEEILKETDDQSLFAWTSETVTDQVRDGLSGLLAESPEAFENVRNVRPLPPLLTRDSVPSSITNQGLRIQLYLVTVIDQDPDAPEEEYQAILDCSLRKGFREYCPTIYLRRLWGDQFARVRTRECVFLPLPAVDEFARKDGYQTVFVKQRPVYIIPEFTLPTGDAALPDNVSAGEPWVLHGVHPPERWHSSSMSLKSSYSQLGRVMGVFRFSHPSYPETQVDVAVGLRRVNQKRWESWCIQQRCNGDTLDHVFQTFERVMRNRYDRRSSIKPSATFPPPLEKDDKIESQASVVETQLHGRGYLAVYVSGKPEIDSFRELKSLSDATINKSSFYAFPNFESGFAMTFLDDETKRLTMTCTTDDALESSIFTGSFLANSVRVSKQLVSTSLVVITAILSSIDPKQLQAKNVDMTPLFQKLSTELLVASKEGNIDEVNRIIRHGNKMGWNALIEAEAENFYSFCALHLATISGHLRVARILVKSGAYKHHKTAHGITPVHLAAMMGHLEILKLFFESTSLDDPPSIDALLSVRTSGTLETPYHLVAAYIRPEAAEKFLNVLYSGGLDRYPPLVSANYLDETPLHRAAAMNNVEVVTTILQTMRHFPVNIADKFGRTPLWHAACGNSPKAIKALASHGAMLDLADDLGRTPLHAACRGGATDAVDALLRLGANSSCAPPPLCLTAFHYAALFGRVACIDLLLQSQADANVGTTPLAYFRPIHLAAANGWLKCVVSLCSAGCDPDTPSSHYILLDSDRMGAHLVAQRTQSAEELAVLHGHKDVVQFFQNRKSRRPAQAEIPDQLLSRMDLGTLEGDLTLR